MKVDLSVPAPDYVFSHDYDLRTVEELSDYISSNGHLPEVPSAREMADHGIRLGNMNMVLLKKIEELTLYVIDIRKENRELREESEALRKENEALRKEVLQRLAVLEKQLADK